MKPLFTLLAAFAAGVVVGAWWMSGGEKSTVEESVVEVAEVESGAIAEADFAVDTVMVGGGAVVAGEEPAPLATVEVVVDDSPDPSSELTAAHRARQAKRAMARSVRESNRRDFLASLNFDLLTPDQQKLHAEYIEAIATRDAVRKEMADLKSKGKEIPEELQRNLADAASVIRADAAEEHRALREAASRAAGLDEKGVRQLLDDLESVDSIFAIPPNYSGR